MTSGLTLGDIKFLVVKGKGTDELTSASIDELKTGLSSLTSLNLNEVFNFHNDKEIQKMSLSDLSQFTHVISNSIDFPNYEIISIRLMIPVVTPQWLKEIIKNKKIEPLRTYSPNPKHIFKSVSICICGGLTNDDKEILKSAVRIFGGLCFNDLRRTLTHYVTNDINDDNSKLVKAFNDINPDGRQINIVKISWLFDSIFKGTIVSEKLHSFELNKNDSYELTIPKFLKQLKFTISNNLELSDSMKLLFEEIIVKENSKGTIHLTRYIDTTLDISFIQRTFDYFFSLILNKTEELKFDSLLYYPGYKNPVIGMDNTLIATTNYTGDSRIYIEELIIRMGGKFGKTLKTSNTHLVASKHAGMKIEYAENWGVKIINHAWVEDSFVNWKMMDESKYSKLPRDNNDVRLLGDIKFNGFKYSNEKIEENKKNVENGDVIMDSQVDDEGDNQVVLTEESLVTEKRKPIKNKSDIIENSKEVLEKEVLEKKISKDEVQIPSTEEGLNVKEKSIKKNKRKVIEKEKPTVKPVVVDKEVEEVKESKKKIIKKKESKVKEKESNLKEKESKVEEKEPEQSVDEENLIWEIPEYEEKSKPIIPAKRSSSVIVDDTASEKNSKNTTSISKKQMKTDKPYNISAIVTGFDGELSLTDKRKLKKIGISIVDNSNKTLNCIIAPSLLRTQKFLTALSYDPKYIIEPLFLSDVLGTLDSVKKIGEFESISPKVETYNIWEHVNFDKDIKPKRLFHKNTTKEQAIEYMKKPRKGLFDGFAFNLSPGLAGGFDTLKNILKSFGCKQCTLFKDATKNILLNEEKTINHISGVAILVCSIGENKIQKHFIEICTEQKIKYVILEWDVIVTAIFEASLKLTKSN
ncbi:hypothetical protein C6P40_001381, partial [Pichia californica]